jgi:hypothetical protein
VSPAAGPLTLVCERLIAPTTIPPRIPAINPAIGAAPEACATPRHSGSATRNTTVPEIRSRPNVPAKPLDVLAADIEVLPRISLEGGRETTIRGPLRKQIAEFGERLVEFHMLQLSSSIQNHRLLDSKQSIGSDKAANI